MFKIKSNWIIILLLIDISLSSSAFSIIEIEEYYTIQAITEYFQKICPTQSCVLVNVGRSLTPIFAYLQDEPDYIWNVPLTNFRYGTSYKEDDEVIRDLSEEEKSKLFTHFTTYMPSEKELNNRSVLVIDFSIFGDSFLASTRYIQEFLIKRNPHTKVNSLALIVDGDEESLNVNILNYITLHGDSVLTYNLLDSIYDDISPYGSFDIIEDPVVSCKVELRPEFKSYLNEMKEMKANEENRDFEDIKKMKALVKNYFMDKKLREENSSLLQSGIKRKRDEADFSECNRGSESSVSESSNVKIQKCESPR